MAEPNLENDVSSLQSELIKFKYADKLHQALYKITLLSQEDIALKDLYAEVHNIVNKYIHAKNFFIGLLNEEEQSLTLPYFSDEKDVDDKDMTDVTIFLGDGISSYVINTKKPQLLTPNIIEQLIKEKKIGGVLGADDFVCWMGAPMVLANRIHGLVVVQSYSDENMYNEMDLEFLDYVANQIASAIENNINLQQRKDAQRRLAEQHRLLESQNQTLTQTIDDLKKAQEELVQKEKMASLGGLVAGIAHEINTPLGICVTGVSHLIQEHKYIKDSFDNGSLTEDELVDFFDELEQGFKILTTNTQRGAELVRSFKQVAVDQSSNEVRTINVKGYLNEILLSLKPKLKRVKHKIVVDCEQGLAIDINAGAISQIFSNLIMNSIIHGFEGIEEGSIQIKIYKKNDNLVIHYADNGRGVEQSKLPQLFEPFYTTKRGEGGSGLGTHLVYNLVHSSLNGKIKVQSEEGKGLAYLIKVPFS